MHHHEFQLLSSCLRCPCITSRLDLYAYTRCIRQLGSHTPALTISVEYSRDLRSPICITWHPGVSLWLPPGPINYCPKQLWVELSISQQPAFSDWSDHSLQYLESSREYICGRTKAQGSLSAVSSQQSAAPLVPRANGSRSLQISGVKSGLIRSENTENW